MITSDATPSTLGHNAYDSSHKKLGKVGRDTSRPTTDDAMTRSEERLRVGKETGCRSP